MCVETLQTARLYIVFLIRVLVLSEPYCTISRLYLSFGEQGTPYVYFKNLRRNPISRKNHSSEFRN